MEDLNDYEQLLEAADQVGIALRGYCRYLALSLQPPLRVHTIQHRIELWETGE